MGPKCKVVPVVERCVTNQPTRPKRDRLTLLQPLTEEPVFGGGSGRIWVWLAIIVPFCVIGRFFFRPICEIGCQRIIFRCRLSSILSTHLMCSRLRPPQHHFATGSVTTGQQVLNAKTWCSTDDVAQAPTIEGHTAGGGSQVGLLSCGYNHTTIATTNPHQIPKPSSTRWATRAIKRNRKPRRKETFIAMLLAAETVNVAQKHQRRA